MKPAQQLMVPSRSRGLLGTLLLKQQLITNNQLDKAIEHQCSHGGRLGTCLLETRCIDEDKLTRALCLQWQRPYFESSLLMDIPGNILQLLSAKIVSDNKILPFKRDNTSLFIAVSNCRNLLLFQKLENLTGLHIIPVIFSDMRLAVALNKHFALPLLPRYEKLAISLNNLALLQINTHSEQQPASHSIAKTGPDKRLKTVNKKALVAQQTPYDALIDYLTHATSRQEIISAFFTYAQKRAITSAFFIVRNEALHGWACSKTAQAEKFYQVRGPINDFPIMKKVIENRRIHYGSYPVELSRLGINYLFDHPQGNPFFIAPLTIKDRTIAVLCMEFNKVASDDQILRERELCQKLELAFQLVIIRNKIMATSGKQYEQC